jgi:hypothetical protein
MNTWPLTQGFQPKQKNVLSSLIWEARSKQPCDPAWMLDSTAPDLLSALGTAAWNQA